MIGMICLSPTCRVYSLQHCPLRIAYCHLASLTYRRLHLKDMIGMICLSPACLLNLSQIKEEKYDWYDLINANLCT
jgi:hypothetical protein